MFAAFGALALMLAAVGLYSLIAYDVAQRRRELSVRIALGAPSSRVVRMVIGRGLMLVGAGLVVGTAVALWATPRLEGLMFYQAARDPLVFGGWRWCCWRSEWRRRRVRQCGRREWIRRRCCAGISFEGESVHRSTHMSARSWVAPVFILAIGAAGYIGYQRTTSCVVGVSGTAATLTVRGWRASSLCDGLVASTSRNYYRRDEAAVGNVLCEYDDAGKHYTVRDQGVVMLVGRAICAELARDPAAVRRAAGK